MSYRILIAPEAHADARKIQRWYMRESPGAEDRFMDEFYGIAKKIADHPHRFSPVFKDAIRVARLKRFPYKVFFRVNELMQRIEIAAIIHNERHPRVWQSRLRRV